MEGSIIEKCIKEYQELKEYKELYEHQKIDKRKMSEKLYEYELKEYKQTDYKQRVEEHIKEHCENCKWYYGKDRECKWLEGTPKTRLPEDILKPIESNIDYFPRT